MIAGIIGATGYAGAELVRLLAAHPRVNGLALASVSFEGQDIDAVYPNFWGLVPGGTLVTPEEAAARADLVFSALPHGAGEPYAKACIERGVSFIDLSADFRFGEDEALFSAWYGKPYLYPELRRRSVYGLPELNRAKIRELAASGPVIIGNPGCYPTAAALGAFPALAKGLTGGRPDAPETPGKIIVDAASGITGGGREPQRSFHYPECADSVSPYKVGSHRHTPEIARTFAAMAAGNNAGETVGGKNPAPRVVFTPHLVPMNRGILSTMYIPLAPAWQAPAPAASPGSGALPRPPSKEIEAKAGEIRELYAEFYRDEPFVRVLPAGLTAASNRVRQSNFCDISIHPAGEGGTLIVISAIDNMMKGAAGQAVQNMNLIMGFDEAEGLKALPSIF